VNISLNGISTNPATKQSYRFFSRNGGGLRLDRIGDPNTGIDPKDDRLHFLDVGAFSVQLVNTPSNASRNVAYGPKAFTTSLSLSKHFKSTEWSQVDLRFEAFNAFNNVNFESPAGDLSQLGLRHDFERGRSASGSEGSSHWAPRIPAPSNLRRRPFHLFGKTLKPAPGGATFQNQYDNR
jgi:hypothetical protein